MPRLRDSQATVLLSTFLFAQMCRKWRTSSQQLYKPGRSRRRSRRWKHTKNQLPKTLKTAVVSYIYVHIYATQLSSQALRPIEHNATPCCSYQLTNGILGWLQLSSIIVGLLSLQMYLGNEQMYLTLSFSQCNTWTFVKVYFAGWFKH